MTQIEFKDVKDSKVWEWLDNVGFLGGILLVAFGQLAVVLIVVAVVKILNGAWL